MVLTVTPDEYRRMTERDDRSWATLWWWKNPTLIRRIFGIRRPEAS